MEPIFLTCMVIAFFFTKGKVDSKAYENGKEPPGVAKARMRHDTGGGARSASGRPKGKGAFRLMLADRWANACEAARQRGDHKAKRRRAWYDETAPLRDAEWREKQLAKLEKKNDARARWAADRGLIDLSERRERKAEDEAWKENERRGAEAAAATDPAAEAKPTDGKTAGDPADSTGKSTGKTDPAKPTAPVTPDTKPAEPAATEGKADDTDETKPAPTDGEKPAKGEKPEEPKAEAAPGEGCMLVPSGASTACGAPRVKGQAYCAKHCVGGTYTQCRYQAPGEAQCPNRREELHDFCKVHKAEAQPKQEPSAPSTPDLGTGDSSTTDSASPSPNASQPAEAKVPNTGTEGHSTVYQQAVTRLIAAADQVAEYRADLAAFADTLDGKRWGTEVTGPIKDMDGQLAALEGDYRDLAAQMKHQGDQGAAAHEQARWVPADDSILV